MSPLPRIALISSLAVSLSASPLLADVPVPPAPAAGTIRGDAFVPRMLVAYPAFGDGRAPLYAVETALAAPGQAIACRDLGGLLHGQRLVSLLVPWTVGAYAAAQLEHFRSTTYPQGVARANFATASYGVERLTHDRLPEPNGAVRVLQAGSAGRVAVDLDWPDGSSLHGEMDVVFCQR